MSHSLEVLFDNAADAIFIADKASGIILDANKAASRLLQLPHEKIVGMHQSKLHPQKDTKSFTKHKKELDETDITVPLEWKVVCSDGSEIPVEILPSQIDYDGKQCMMGIFRDISIRKQTEQLNIELNNFKTAIENSMQAGVVVVNPEGKQSYVNSFFCEMVGWSAEELLDESTPFVYWSPDEIDNINNAFEQTLQGEAPKNGFELKFIRKNKEVIDVLVRLSELKNAKNEIIGWLAIVNDITDHKQTEQNLIESEEKSRLLIKNSNDIIVLVNEKGEQTFVSDVVENITGYTAEELYGNILDVIHPDDLELVSQHWTEVLSNPKKPARVQYRHKHKVKGYVWLEAVAQNFLDNPSIKSVVVNIRDITNNKESETKLKKLNATKDKLFSIIAHDLRSPLTNILGFSDLMTKNLQTSDIEKAKKYAAVINTSAKNNLNLVDNLLFWTKTQTEEIEFEPENNELKPIVEESLMVLNTSALFKEIKLINSVSGDIVACADPDMLKTILRNLVQNAIKFTESNGKIEINAISQKDHIEISVTDNGLGITEENQKKLFGADLNFSMNGTANESGTGLGLLLCKEFVEKHGGKIWVESQAGKGSKFLFTLPVSAKSSD